MPSKPHQQKIREIEEEYLKRKFICKKQFPLFNPNENNFSLIDLVCFRGNLSRAFEIEQSGKHVLKNAKDLEKFKSTFKNAKICQLSVDGNLKDCPDFFKKSNVIVRRARI